MKKDRRSRERRTPAGFCTTCHHPVGDHYDGRGPCIAAGGCSCQAFTAAKVKPAPKAKKVKKVVKAKARKKR